MTNQQFADYMVLSERAFSIFISGLSVDSRHITYMAVSDNIYI